MVVKHALILLAGHIVNYQRILNHLNAVPLQVFFVEERSLVKKFEWKRTDYLLDPGHKLKGDRVSLFCIFPYSVEIR